MLAFSFRIEAQRSWERFTAPPLLWLSSGVLALSSVMLESARHALRRALVAIYRGRVAGTLALAAVFLGAQLASAMQLAAQGIGTAANPHGSAFYIFMALHGAHLAGGTGWLAYLFAASRSLFTGSENDLRKHRRVAAAAALYWHFMGVLWAVLFFFLLRWTRG